MAYEESMALTAGDRQMLRAFVILAQDAAQADTMNGPVFHNALGMLGLGLTRVSPTADLVISCLQAFKKLLEDLGLQQDAQYGYWYAMVCGDRRVYGLE